MVSDLYGNYVALLTAELTGQANNNGRLILGGLDVTDCPKFKSLVRAYAKDHYDPMQVMNKAADMLEETTESRLEAGLFLNWLARRPPLADLLSVLERVPAT